MLILFGLMLLLFVVQTVFLAFWTIFLQGYLYTEPTTGVTWRAPAAGGVLTFVLLIWLVCDYQVPGGYRPLWEFSSTDATIPFPELRLASPQGEDVYKLRPGSRNDYRLDGRSSGRPLPSRPREVIVVEGDKRSVFKAELDEKGNFKQRGQTRFGQTTHEPLRYIDEYGRVMFEGSIGQLTVYRTGRFLGNILLNLFFFAACFASLWLLLRFQWPHALGQAAVVWALILLFVWPPVLSQVEHTSRERSAARSAAP